MKVVTCIKNPKNDPFIKIGSVYEVISNHPQQFAGYFLIKAERYTYRYIKVECFEDIADKRNRIITEILK